MLTYLHIQNYALISRLDIDFSKGFSVLTGETGAGKSIILGALSLVMGSRADSKAITDGEDKCIIEAEFTLPADNKSCLIRRELYSNGKSRSFVDDSLVTLQELKALTSQLIDIHSQHANLLIENAEFQLSVVDAIAQNEQLTAQYSADYEAYIAAVEALNKLQEQAKKSRQDADYIQYRYRMLSEAELKPGELEELEQEQYNLTHAEEIRSALEHAVLSLTNEESGAIDTLRNCRLDEIAPELQERIDSARIELQDIAAEAEHRLNRIEMDPTRLEQVEERLDQLNTLLRKFDAENIEALIQEREELSQQADQIDSFDFEIAQAKKEADSLRTALTGSAQLLTKSRQSVVGQICQRLSEGMKQLGVPHAKIEIPVTTTADFTPSGCDEVQILFAANLNQNLRPVSEVASGGEISRLMLCVKSLIAATKGLPTIIFDEIDTGVSGNIAVQMASIMRQMAVTRQIIAITHLPQIAALGEHHYKVYKADTAHRTETHIRLLSEEERITEIASMLSGQKPTEEAIANAKQLLCSH